MVMEWKQLTNNMWVRKNNRYKQVVMLSTLPSKGYYCEHRDKRCPHFTLEIEYKPTIEEGIEWCEKVLNQIQQTKYTYKRLL